MYQHPHFYHVTNEYFLLKKNAYFMISESWTFGLQNLFVRTREPFFSNSRTFGLKNRRTHEPSNLRTFGLIGCNRLKVGDLLIKNISTLCITMSSIPGSRSVVISVPLIRQRRHLERIQLLRFQCTSETVITGKKNR